MWGAEITANAADKDPEQDLKEFRRWLDTPPPEVKGKPKKIDRWSAEEEMLLFEDAKKSMKGG